MKNSDKDLALRIYLILAALFIASLVTANLIFKKFISIDFLGIYTFKISVGVLPYPITFLITDTISEIYGKRKANWVVTSGIFASIFTLLIVLVASYFVIKKLLKEIRERILINKSKKNFSKIEH